MTGKRFWAATVALAVTFGSVGFASPRDARPINAPLSFEPNQGQADPAVQFVSRGDGYVLRFKTAEVVLNSLRMTLAGANAHSRAAGIARQSGRVSYFIGNDPRKWRTGIPTYGQVNYAQIYPGIDLVFYGNQRQLEYDFVVAPGADPARIAWHIDGAHPAIDGQGNLILNAQTSFKKPVLYQLDGDRKLPVDGSFTVAGNRIGFRLGRYDHSKTLIIDPVLSFVSYIDGSINDSIGHWITPGILQNGWSQGLAIDSAGSVYVAGYTTSLDFPTQNPYQAAPPAKGSAAPTVFVSKFSPDGSSLVYSTYIGGTSWDYGYALAVDSNGSAYVTGLTNSEDFPVTPGAYQTICNPVPTNYPPPKPSSQGSAFLTKLDPTGSILLYSTFLGGYGMTYGTAVAVDAAGNAYLAGNSSVVSSNTYVFTGAFPTTAGAVIGGQELVGGGVPQMSFLAVFDPTGSQLLYSTLLGDLEGLVKLPQGQGDTYASGVTIDAKGYFYLAGLTKAEQFPTTPGVVQPAAGPQTPQTGLQSWRGYVAKFYPLSVGPALVWATYLGGQYGSRQDFATGIALDGGGNVYITGNTNSADYPTTPGAYQTQCGYGDPTGQCQANFVTKLSPDGSTILWSTYVGNAKTDGSDNVGTSGSIQLDGNGNVYIVGTAPQHFPMVNPVEPYNYNGGEPGVLVAELDPTGSTLLFSTLIGSGGLDSIGQTGMAVDPAGNIYVAGNTGGPDLITTPGAFMTSSKEGGCCNSRGFVARIAAQGTANVTLKSSQAGPTLTLTARVSPPQQYASMPTGQVVFFNGDSAFAVVNLDATGTATYSTSTAPPGTYTITAQYSGDSTYAAASATITATLNPLP